ncbi:MAG: VCBS repeat-containing protein [Synechococcales cyanobacterium RM1_1_8]|nr:VCBS repeat-containing protein [Synechococcales cyanobacterium RM1_1_8]
MDGSDFDVLDQGDTGPLQPDGRRDIEQAGAAYIFRSQPQVQSVTPNVFFVNDPLVQGTNPDALGVSQLLLTVVYDQPMNQSTNPTIAFPTPGENPGTTLTFSSGAWTGPSTYVARYNLTDANIEQINIDISVDGAIGVGGAPQLPALPPAAVVTDIFSIDTRNPVPQFFAPFFDKNVATPAPAFINRSFSILGNFDEVVSPATNPLTPNSFPITNGIISNFEFDGGGTYKFDVTPQAEGQVIVGLDPARAVDLRLNPSLPAPQVVLTYDITPPSVTLTPNEFDPAAGPLNGPFSLTANFSEIVVGFDISDISVTNGVVSSFVADPGGSQYTFVIDPTSNDPIEQLVTVNIAPGAASDRATNPSSALGTAFSVAYDSRRPAVTLASSASGTVEEAFTVSVFFTEDVSGLELSEFFVTNGVATNLVAVSGSTYNVTITPTLGGQVTVALGDGAAQDAAANPNTASNVFTINYAPPFPQVLSVTPSELLITDALAGDASWTLSVAFSEEMDQTIAPQITLSASGADLSSLVTAGGSWNASGTVYTQTYNVSDTNIDLEGIDIAVSGGTSLVNRVSPSPNPTIFSDRFSIDTSNPEVTLTAEGATQPFTVVATFSEPVENFDIGDLEITNGEIVGTTITEVSAATIYSFQVRYGTGDDPLQPISVSVKAGPEEVGSGNVSQPSAPLLIDAINDAPAVSGPITVQTATGNTDFIFSQAKGNAIKITDPDAGLQDVLVTLTGTSGTVSIVENANVTVTGNGTNSVAVQGSLADINAALDGASFKAINLPGDGSLKIDVDDLGNTGSGGAKTDSEIVNFAIEELTRHDLDGDGFSDFVWRDNNSGQVILWYMDGTTFNGRGAIVGTVPGQNFQIQGTGDLNLDGKTDIVWRDFDSGATFVWFMDGGTFLGAANINAEAPQDAGWFVESVADINRDGKQDLLWRNRSTNTIVAWYLDSGTNGSNIPLIGGGVLDAPGLDWQVQGMGDLNGDSNPDIIWRNTVTATTAIWYMDGLTLLPGSGAAVGSNVATPGLEWEIQGVGDYNGDGTADVVWRQPSASQTVIWTLADSGTTVTGGSLVTPSVPASYELGLN